MDNVLDAEIRMAYLPHIEDEFRNENYFIKPEFVISEGFSRVDIAVITDNFYGYEIKSDGDSLKRLAKQSISYSANFDYMTLLTTEKHVDYALDIIPDWWRVVSIKKDSLGNYSFTTIREGDSNSDPESLKISLVMSLKEEECKDILKMAGQKGRDCCREDINSIRRSLLNLFSSKELKSLISIRLKGRFQHYTNSSYF